MMKKIGNLVVAVGTEHKPDGTKRTIWENVGTQTQNEKGQTFLMLKRTFNPSGVPLADNGSNVRDIMVCVFPDKKQEGYSDRF